MDTFLQDLRTGARSLAKNPGMTAAAVLALALGIGANAAIFGFVDAMLLRPFSFSTDGLVFLSEKTSDNERNEATPASFVDWKEARSLERLDGYWWWEVNLTGVQEPEHLIGYRVTPGLFSTLRVAPALGRTFAADEDAPGRDHVVVLSDELWRRRFDAQRDVIGRTVRIDGESFTVVGVMPPDFFFPKGAQLYSPLAITAELRTNRTSHWMHGVGRLGAGATLEVVQAELDANLRRVQKEFPNGDPGHAISLVPLRDYGDPEAKVLLLVCLAAVGMVLLIACANVGALLLARAAGRGRELAVRAALGASRGRLVRQLLTESLLLSLLACAVGVIFASWGIDVMLAPMPRDVARWIPGWYRVGLDARLLAFSLGASVITAAVAGLLPALRASGLQLHEALQREGLSASAGRERHRAQRVLVSLETALALVLVVLAALMLESLFNLRHASGNAATDHVLTLRLAPAEAKYRTDAEVVRYHQEALRRLSSLPGVNAVGAVNRLPQSGSWEGRVYQIDGRPAPRPADLPGALFQPVLGEYFAAMGIPLLRGRLFSALDAGPDAAPALLISQEVARREFGKEDPLGRRLRLGRKEGAPWRTIVGVVGNVRHTDGEDEGRAVLYVPEEREGNRQLGLVVRTEGQPGALASSVRAELRALDAEQPIGDLKPMSELIKEKAIPWNYAAGMLGTFACIALLLGAVGIYGVMAYSVNQRSREMGIRLALGAQRGDVVRLVVREGMMPALVGLLIGLAGALLAARPLGFMLYGVAPGDWRTHAGAALFLGAIALLASWLPARRASRVDPMVALRAE